MQLFSFFVFAKRFLSNSLVFSKAVLYSCIKLNNLRDFFDQNISKSFKGERKILSHFYL